eukprot:10625572-Lingulodinium_polyedra.AAC.1
MDSRLQSRRRLLCKIINHLMNNTDQIVECWSLLQDGACKASETHSDEGWDRTVSSVGRLPKYWKGQ